MSFEERHPGLKGRICDSEEWPLKDGRSFLTVDIEDVDATQLDKEIVRQKLDSIERNAIGLNSRETLLNAIRREFGL